MTAGEDERNARLAALVRSNADGRNAGLVEGVCWILERGALVCGELGLPSSFVDEAIEDLARKVGDRKLVADELKRRGFAVQARRLLELDRLAEGARPPDANSPEGVGAKGAPGGWTGGR